MLEAPWIYKVRLGDVLEWPSGKLRIVRAIHRSDRRGRYNYNPLRGIWFYFSIQRCSWTHACYTLYNGAELIGLGVRPVRGRMPVNTAFDKLIAADFGRHGKDRHLTCCDVRGLA